MCRLQRFLERLARHPVLCRAKLLRNFIESSEWKVDMHTHLAHPPIPEAPASLLEMASDTLLNAFSKVRKPDERFVEVKEGLDRFEERMMAIERIESRSRTRTTGAPTHLVFDWAVSDTILSPRSGDRLRGVCIVDTGAGLPRIGHHRFSTAFRSGLARL